MDWRYKAGKTIELYNVVDNKPFTNPHLFSK